MKKSSGKKLIVVSLFLLSLSLVGCKEDTGGKTKLSFFSWGNETEVIITNRLVEQFNAENTDNIEVVFTQIPSGDYETKVNNALRGRNVPDVLIAGDGEIKAWIEAGGLEPLDAFVEKSATVKLDDMWEDGVNRYRYSTTTKRGGEGKLYGIMRDYSPSVIYYNLNAMRAVGVTPISLTPQQSLATYGDASAYFTHDGKEYFNNQVPLDWDELKTLSQKLTSNVHAPVRNNDSITKFGLYVANWFSLGWSVGGDSLKWVSDASLPTGGKYEFSLFDEEPNYIVKDGESVTVNGTLYAANEIIEYGDRKHLTDSDKAKLTVLPSMLEALTYYVNLSTTDNISPRPDVTASNSTYGLFSSQQTAMLIDTRYAVGIFRETIKNSFEWDVAPLPKHKNGIVAGHSGSLAFSIAAKSRNKEKAWKFIEFIVGETGQTAFTEAGFTIPNTAELANSEVFLQPDLPPANSKIFVDAAYYQTVGDWGYLPSKAWINEWASILNSDVLSGRMTIAELKARTQASTQAIIDQYFEER